MSKRSIENVADELFQTVEPVEVIEAVEEFVPVEVIEPVKEKEIPFKILFKSTKLKQLLVDGKANTDFVVLDTVSNVEVGKGTTNGLGQAICICDRVNDKLRVIKKALLFLLVSVSVFAQNATQVNTPIRDATTTIKGRIRLAGDLGGTANNPTVPGLLLKEPLITAGTASQYFRGDKTWQTLDKSAVGLGNVDNTSDANKPDFWRVGVGATGAKPDGTTDVTDAIGHKSDIYVGLDALMRVGHGAGNLASNVAVGNFSLENNTTGESNTANGNVSLFFNTTGSSNTANGEVSLHSNTIGNRNTASGRGSLYSNTTGSNNVAVGEIGGFENTTGSNNTYLGANTGRYITTGSNNTILGANVALSNPTLSNNIILADGSGNTRLQGFATGNIGINTTVDAGYKLDVNGTVRATQFNLSALNTAPASATATGTTGEIRVTATHIYVCTATNVWVRSELSTW